MINGITGEKIGPNNRLQTTNAKSISLDSINVVCPLIPIALYSQNSKITKNLDDLGKFREKVYLDNNY